MHNQEINPNVKVSPYKYVSGYHKIHINRVYAKYGIN